MVVGEKNCVNFLKNDNLKSFVNIKNEKGAIQKSI